MKQNYCPCGGIILADTEEWRLPRCYSCWEKIGSPAYEPASDASDEEAAVNYVGSHWRAYDAISKAVGKESFIAGAKHGRLSAQNQPCKCNNCNGVSPLSNQLEQERQRSARLLSALKELNIPYSAVGPREMPRFPEVIIREAIAEYERSDDEVS